MSDLKLQYPWEKRQTQQDIDAQIASEKDSDGEIMFNPEGNSTPMPSHEHRKINEYKPSFDEIHDQPAKEVQSSEKRAPLTNDLQNDENEMNAFNTAGITVADVMIIKILQKKE